MSEYRREFEEAREQIDAALRRLPDSLEHCQSAIGILLATAGALAKTLPPDMQQFWAGYCYEIADDLASPQPCADGCAS